MSMLRTTALLLTLVFPSLSALATEYPLPAAQSRLIGENQYYTVPEGKHTLEDIAAKYQLGLSNLLEANPGVDPFLPKPGSQLLIPLQLILPNAPREGIVINVAEMRLYYYPKGKKTVEVLPIGIGQIGKDTPENWVTSVQRKRANPTWTPTPRIRKEYAAKGEILPAVWPAGPDNPMGLYALYIGNLYAIHGTNASFGIGLRVSQGCVRLRHDDIEHLFKNVPVGTRVQFVNQPIKATEEPDGKRYLAVHQPLSRTVAEFESNEPVAISLPRDIAKFIAKADTNSSVIKKLLDERTGVPMRINQ
ncbi:MULTISPECIES: L,D-transpeptidase family protein [Shewanella]|uniref:L,D-transpeptidase family protein n=1 Tax=Shewanella vaxholmensis TaxID=3063535 RepID=A0ABU9UN22_9GAMM|nr:MULTISPECIES: L,D-transpeptidase family protein [Shewanella]EGT3625996.1 LysM peptidoglycan-binding domain-containing protein [Morganella morganii]MBU1393059.1 L,D-transpeptidase family protein [Gammaproteobacteria bacterium]AUD59281.1 L,D-transpeptidase [Shewanella sp. Pdp11]MBU1478560.1 L,D-transpeptidase family protein [Gammaproteobacteria bacterium]MBU2002474.1 L,D-transpeptidase family protein [Gammaproteobacteria bacterium]